MNERPILFSGQMVKAILAGRKTQTRRVVKGVLPLPPGVNTSRPQEWSPWSESVTVYRPGEWGRYIEAWPNPGSWGLHGVARCPYGAPGDRLVVRETWHYADAGHGPCVEYAAGGPVLGILRPDLLAAFPGPDTRWRPSIHMPRWASRITLEVVGVRVERVQSIAEEDARAEGCTLDGAEWRGGFVEDHRQQFARLWDSINGKRPGCAWKDSPWVWVVAFRRLP